MLASMVRRACGVLLASVFMLTSCSRVVSFRPTQLAALQGLAAEREVEIVDEDGDELTINRNTRLTLHIPGYPPIEARPERLGFSPTALRLGSAFDPNAPTVAYTQIARVDAKVRNMTGTLLAIFIPIGVVLTLFIICSADGSCPGE
jgi:hypothetical protein